VSNQKQLGLFSLPVIVGALGFFVDVYDLLLFNFVRIKSLTDLGASQTSLKILGESILSWQMIGLTVGGVLWGMMGDKQGRKSVLFGSIIVYSLATIANGLVTNVDQYLWLRFIAGLGLAGELGASITLTSEILPPEKRGLASSIIAASGVLGTTTAYLVFNLTDENWRLCYFIGGAMGIGLLFLRVGVLESKLYDATKKNDVVLGDFSMFLTNRERFFRYLRGILIGLPVWYTIGILVSFSDEFAFHFGISDFSQPKALMLQYVALMVGDLTAGILSNLIKSRKKTLLIYYGIMAVFISMFFILKGGGSAYNMYLLCMGLGFGSGLSVLYITMSAEQFGTNLRATAAISIPNLVRGFLPLMLLLFQLLRSEAMLNDYVTAAWVIGIIVMVVGFISVVQTRESFGRDLNYLET
jgi:MFS family permease